MLALRLPEEVEERLNSLAKATGRSKSYYAREAIVTHIDELEAIYVAEQRLEELRAGRTHTVPLSQVMNDYGL
ncbi:MAG TPA: DUF6290 family protein [Mycobacteriales bacterium]|jgi:RHH-type rel operon transcriptional repressor/antitoxin RelB|nr:DUF6290 family protein [Mycobacteriales bacterium]